MKGAAIILALALLSAIAFSGVIVSNSAPLLTVSAVNSANIVNTQPQIPVVFQFGTITVPRQLWFVGLHGLAYKQLTYLYPTYKTHTVHSCAYTVYGPSRIYSFELASIVGQTIKVFSSVQNNEEATGEQTQETVEQEAKAEINAKEANKNEKVDNENSGFNVIKLSRAYEIPRVAVAIKDVTRSHWRVIRSSPLVRCLERWSKGVYSFRFFFDGIPQWFEIQRAGQYESQQDEVEGETSNLRTEILSDFYDNQIAQGQATNTESSESTIVVAEDEDYLPITQPIFSVQTVDGYGLYNLDKFRIHPGYKTVVSQLTDHFGRFDEQWISRIQYRVDIASVHYFQIQVQFIPFLCDVDLEAHYYGSTQKAAILQIDERVFSSHEHKGRVDKWNEIKEFNSYKAFKDANQYVLSQFTYLRFYKVISAYSALHNNGRYVRLVYQSENNFFTPNGENQFNILVYISKAGCFFIEREDFLATNTQSQGYAGWLAMFVDLDNFNEKAAYKNIVKYFVNKHKSWWNLHNVDEVKVKDDVYVVKFRNPKNNDSENKCVLSVKNNEVKILNHFNWTKVDEKSVHHSKAINYIKGKFQGCTPMFVQTLVSPWGRHFEVSYVDAKGVFGNSYLRYVDAEDLITEDEWQGIAYEIDFEEVPLPTDAEEKLTKWLAESHGDLVAIVDLKNAGRNAYQCVALIGSERWRINANWVKGAWVLSSKEVVSDGYYFVTGYPSVATASTTGYLARLYPTSFNSQWIYSAIEVKNIGYFVYNRIIYRLGGIAYQGIVRTTHGVENSHTLISWDKCKFLRAKQDYGYGINYDWTYGYNSRFFFDYSVQPVVSQVQIRVEQPEVTVVVVDKTDLLCTYWDDEKCLSCAGDYFADDNGRCVRIDDECEYWKVSGVCSRCTYGWFVGGEGRCVSQASAKIVRSQ